MTRRMSWIAAVVLIWSLPGTSGAAEARALGEVVVVVTAVGQALVGVGEPPGEDRIPGLVYIGAGGIAEIDLASQGGPSRCVARAMAARTALGGLPALRRFAARGAPAERVAALDASLAEAGFTLQRIDPSEAGADPTRQMTADPSGYHRRDQAGTPAADAAEAVRGLIAAAGYGTGHGQPAYETGPDGKPRMSHPPGWQEPIHGYACPFPANPALQPPPGMVVEIYASAERDGIVEEAMAQWCDHAARALLQTCGGDALLAELEGGPAEIRWGQPPAEGLWWLTPERVAPPGSSALAPAESCLTEALQDWSIAAPYAGLELRLRLSEDDLEQGCERAVEKCG